MKEPQLTSSLVKWLTCYKNELENFRLSNLSAAFTLLRCYFLVKVLCGVPGYKFLAGLLQLQIHPICLS